MTSDAHRDLMVLQAIAEDQGITQRRLALQLGIALGLTNSYLQRLSKQGHIKCVTVGSNRLRYLLTSKGVAEKMRLTYEFMPYSLSLYRQVRQQLHGTLLDQIGGPGPARVAICGTGEAAELAYLTLKEMNVDPVAVLDDVGSGRFLGLPVFDIRQHPLADFDLIIAATLEEQDAVITLLARRGVPEERLVLLRPAGLLESQTVPDRPPARAFLGQAKEKVGVNRS